MWKTFQKPTPAPSAPPVHSFPPEQPEPLVHEGLCPLAMRPPPGSELSVVPRGGHRVIVARHFALENFQSAPSVEIRSHDQHAPITRPRQALLYILRFFLGRESVDRADADRRPPRQIPNVVLG